VAAINPPVQDSAGAFFTTTFIGAM